MRTLEQKITDLLTPSVGSMGYRLVRVLLRETERRRTLQIMAERLDGSGMKVEDCEAISHQAGAVLDVHDPISGQYHLEVSSPGIDRPLVREEDFAKHAGFEMKMETAYPIEGRKRYRGILGGIEGGQVMVTVDGEERRVPFEAIASAKLILTDELIAWYRKTYAPQGGNEIEGGLVDA